MRFNKINLQIMMNSVKYVIPRGIKQIFKVVKLNRLEKISGYLKNTKIEYWKTKLIFYD